MLTGEDWERLVAGVWAELATDHGIVTDAPAPGSGADVVLSGPGLPRTAYKVKRFSRRVQPSAVQRWAAAGSGKVRLLVIAPAASPEAHRVAEAAGVSLVTVRDKASAEGFLCARDRVIQVTPPLAASVRPRARGRVPWGSYAVAFALLEAAAPNQSELAERAGVGRPRVSQVLKQLGNKVARVDDRWVAADRGALMDWLVEHYPRAPRLATTWATLDPPVRAAAEVSRYLDEHRVRHAVSGEVAADRLAPWARPSAAWVWVANPTDLQPAGLTPAPAGAATVTLAVSEDPHLLASARSAADGMPLLPGWRVWVDLMHQGRQDAAQAMADVLAGQVR